MILLVEDNAETAAYVSDGLGALGQAVEIASDGRAGLLRASDPQFDCLVIDRLLPGFDGLTVVRTLRSAGVRTPIIFLTAVGGVADRVQGLKAGADDYLVKPFELEELAARVEALRRRPPLPESQMLLRTVDIELDRLGRIRQARRAGAGPHGQRVQAPGGPDPERRPCGDALHAAANGVRPGPRQSRHDHRTAHQPAAGQSSSGTGFPDPGADPARRRLLHRCGLAASGAPPASGWRSGRRSSSWSPSPPRASWPTASCGETNSRRSTRRSPPRSPTSRPSMAQAALAALQQHRGGAPA